MRHLQVHHASTEARKGTLTCWEPRGAARSSNGHEYHTMRHQEKSVTAWRVTLPPKFARSSPEAMAAGHRIPPAWGVSPARDRPFASSTSKLIRGSQSC